MPLAHVSLPVANLKDSASFYTMVLKPLGYGIFMQVGDAVVGFAPPRAGPDFWLHQCSEKSDTKVASMAKMHVAFLASSQRLVHDFYDNALKIGAQDNGPPGERPQYTKGYYAAYILDPEGNNIECMYYQPWWLTVIQSLPVIAAVGVAGVAWWAGKSG